MYGGFENIHKYCTSDLSILNQDKDTYGFGWSKHDSKYVPTSECQAVYDAFKFRDSSSLQGLLPIKGKYNTYEGNGYLYEMRGRLSFIQGNLTLLKEMNWIDRQTRAVLVEFSVYNPNINLVMVATILVEFLPIGVIVTSARFDPLNLFILTNTFSTIVSIVMLSAIVFFVLYFMLIEVRQILKRDVTEYVGQFWCYIEWSIIASVLCAFVCFTIRLNMGQDVLDFFKE